MISNESKMKDDELILVSSREKKQNSPFPGRISL